MDEITVKKLNRINKDFYAKIALDFDDTRSYYWKGWNTLIETLPKGWGVKALDLGCGNGRFGSFLIEHYPEIDNLQYLGVDNSGELLGYANNKLESSIRLGNSQLVNYDFVEGNVNDISQDKYDLITLFGVMHHIPGRDRRIQLLKDTFEMLESGGFLVFTVWNFMNDERYLKKIVPWEELGIDKTKVEKNDYLLDWQRGREAIRYCHYMDKEELNDITDVLNISIFSSFFADGKEHNLNTYYIIQK